MTALSSGLTRFRFGLFEAIQRWLAWSTTVRGEAERLQFSPAFRLSVLRPGEPRGRALVARGRTVEGFVAGRRGDRRSRPRRRPDSGPIPPVVSGVTCLGPDPVPAHARRRCMIFGLCEGAALRAMSLQSLRRRDVAFRRLSRRGQHPCDAIVHRGGHGSRVMWPVGLGDTPGESGATEVCGPKRREESRLLELGFASSLRAYRVPRGSLALDLTREAGRGRARIYNVPIHRATRYMRTGLSLVR